MRIKQLKEGSVAKASTEQLKRNELPEAFGNPDPTSDKSGYPANIDSLQAVKRQIEKGRMDLADALINSMIGRLMHDNNTEESVAEGYKVLPAIDKERYPEINGLEGPFRTLNGGVVYYDPKEGAYYDKDRDMYLSYDEFRQMDTDYSGMKDERDIPVKEEDDDRDELTKKLFPRKSREEMEKADKERNRKMNQKRFMKPGKPSRSREWGAYEGVNEAEGEGTYARIIYDYSEDWGSIDIYKGHEKVDEWDGYFGANETGNPLAAKFVKMAKANGLDPMTLPLVDENGDIGKFDGKRFKWEDSVTEVSTEKLRDYASAALQDKNKDKADKRWKYAGKATQTVADREAQAAHDRKHNTVEEALTLDYSRYVRSHGKKPRDTHGGGMWMFTTAEYGFPGDDDTFEFSGSFADAKRAAAKWARSKGANRFFVMEDESSDTTMGTITVTTDDERKKRAQMYRDKVQAKKKDKQVDEADDDRDAYLDHYSLSANMSKKEWAELQKKRSAYINDRKPRLGKMEEADDDRETRRRAAMDKALKSIEMTFGPERKAVTDQIHAMARAADMMTSQRWADRALSVVEQYGIRSKEELAQEIRLMIDNERELEGHEYIVGADRNVKMLQAALEKISGLGEGIFGHNDNVVVSVIDKNGKPVDRLTARAASSKYRIPVSQILSQTRTQDFALIGDHYFGIAPVQESEDPCWKGYEQIGMKTKNGKEVPNCVPKKGK
jgi:hypothetical protein